MINATVNKRSTKGNALMVFPGRLSQQKLLLRKKLLGLPAARWCYFFITPKDHH